MQKLFMILALKKRQGLILQRDSSKAKVIGMKASKTTYS
jgi:hypothetical protein